MTDPKWIPPNASPVRLISEGESYVYFNSLDEARNYPNAVAVFEGDTGGQIYFTVPVKYIRCSNSEFETLFHDIDDFGFGDGEMFFEVRNIGQGVSGGMGGGFVIDGVWLHQEFLVLRNRV